MKRTFTKDEIDKVIELDFTKILSKFFPNQKIFKEFNPLEEIWVDKTYCFTCDKEKEFPTMYFTDYAYGCYECGNRGNSFNFLKDILNYSKKEILNFIIDNNNINPPKSMLETLTEEINQLLVEDVHHIFENNKFLPGTACLFFGGPRDYNRNLTDYIQIRKTIWNEYLPKEREFKKSLEKSSLKLTNEDELPF